MHCHHQRLVEAARSTKRTQGLTHGFYRYPARFGAGFVRQAIESYSSPGDLVLDPFMGGGTTAVEALSAGRKFVGCDVNELAVFVTTAKSAYLTVRDEDAIRDWALTYPSWIGLRKAVPIDKYTDNYKLHVPWRIERVLSQALATIQRLKTERQQVFARCSLLSASQWALDCRKHLPNKENFLAHHKLRVNQMLAGAAEYRECLREAGITAESASKRRVLLQRSAAQLHTLKSAKRLGTPRLLLTSPPYLGVHVLYHRWQVQGRRETAAPYWIAGRSDGNSGAHYTFADRRDPNPARYLSKLTECFCSASKLLDAQSHVVQLVAFANAELQLPMYLAALEQAGLENCEAFSSAAGTDAVERNVPNRRWYASLSRQSTSSKEFLLVHRLKRTGGKTQWKKLTHTTF